MRAQKLFRLSVCVLSVLCVPSFVSAQIAMPDPKQMSGIPRPVDDLPSGSISVRLIKGDLSNNIAGHPIELRVGDKIQTVKTDDQGRAQFDKLPAGATVKAVAVVDGETLESQEFPAPTQGGIRLMLVATDKDKERQKAEEAKAPPISGIVVIGGDSRIVIEPGDEALTLFYILEIMNTARAPVNPATPFEFDTPSNSTSTTIMQGSSQLATSTGRHVKIAGPFPPGKTIVQLGIEVPVPSGTVALEQAFPAQLESLVVIAKKDGDMRLTSPQIDRQQDTAVEGTAVIIGAGNAVTAGQPISLTLSGLPHHNSAPRRIALSLAAIIVAIGAWFATRAQDAEARGSERKRLVSRREKLLQDLARLETDHRRGRLDDARFATRREELLGSLEHIYGALDADDLAHA